MLWGGDRLLSVIIPVYNESDTIKEIVEQVKEEKTEKEVIIVDDGSTDGTREILENEVRKKVEKIIFHEKTKEKEQQYRQLSHMQKGTK